MGNVDLWLQKLHALQGLPGYSLLFVLLVGCGIGLPMNEDILILAAASLTLSGIFDPVTLIVVAGVGVVVGDFLIFHWGRKYGTRLLSTRFGSKIVDPKKFGDFQKKMKAAGPAYLFTTRFLPFIRTPLFFAAGTLNYPYRSLWIYDSIAAAIEVPLMVYAVRAVGGNWEKVVTTIREFQSGVLLVAAVVFLFFVWRQFRRSR
ncbi:MAG: DedA family protein [Bdellovibrionales bacterium]|nr:DedA family protein [Bdellovibrionales bacterium]